MRIKKYTNCKGETWVRIKFMEEIMMQKILMIEYSFYGRYMIMEGNLFVIEGEEDYQKGLLYLRGNAETSIDIRKAFEYFNKAANVGHSEAKFQVGYLYGEPNILKNEKRAMQCLKGAADDGIGIAQFYCGIGYFCGNGIEKNVEVGIDYLKKSAKQGCYLAADFLAEIYLTGTEVEKDIDKAKMYNDKARVQGNQNAEIRSVRIMISSK